MATQVAHISIMKFVYEWKLAQRRSLCTSWRIKDIEDARSAWPDSGRVYGMERENDDVKLLTDP